MSENAIFTFGKLTAAQSEFAEHYLIVIFPKIAIFHLKMYFWECIPQERGWDTGVGRSSSFLGSLLRTPGCLM